jgi:hypothetical protein
MTEATSVSDSFIVTTIKTLISTVAKSISTSTSTSTSASTPELNSTFTCEKCKTIYNSQRSCSIHKVNCKGAPPRQCQFCNQIYSCPSSKHRHVRTCTKNPAINPQIATKGVQQQIVNTLDAYVASINPHLNSTQQQILTTPVYSVTPTLIQNNITTNTNTNNITIKVFGKESFNHIVKQNEESLKKYVLNFMTNKYSGFKQMLADRYFHPDIPQNHNIRKLEKKVRYAETYDGKEWAPTPIESVIKTILKQMCMDYENCFTEFILQDGSEGIIEKEVYTDFMKEIGEPIGVHIMGHEDEYDWDWDMNENECEKIKNRLGEIAEVELYHMSATKKNV